MAPALILLIGGSGDLPANAGQEASGDGDVVVQGLPPRCRPREGDPQDAVDLSRAGSGEQQMVRIDPATGRYALLPDTYPLGTCEEWQRDGTRSNNFVFRVPDDDRPSCIGARRPGVGGFAQLRRAFAARPLWGRYVILTARVATRNAGEVAMWIAAGAPADPKRRWANIVAGGPKRVPLKGNFKWSTVNFLMGPIPCMAEQVSYGVTLRGGGDVWLSRPRLVEVPEERLSPSMRARAHGAAMLAADPICRHYLRGETLLEKRGPGLQPVRDDRAITPGVVLYDTDGTGPIPYQRSFAPGLIEF